MGGQVTPTQSWALVLPRLELSGHTPGAELSLTQLTNLADCTNLQTTKLCRLHHFCIYTAPKYSQ